MDAGPARSGNTSASIAAPEVVGLAGFGLAGKRPQEGFQRPHHHPDDAWLVAIEPRPQSEDDTMMLAAARLVVGEDPAKSPMLSVTSA